MPTTLRVDPNDPAAPFDTLQQAHDYGQAGDTIEVAPSATTYAWLRMSKLMHIKGATTDPIANPVRIASTPSGLSGDGCITLALPANTSGELWVEGITAVPRAGTSHGLVAATVNSAYLPAGLRLQLNRCLLTVGYGRIVSLNTANNATPGWVKITNSTIVGPSNGGATVVPCHPNTELRFERCRLTYVPFFGTGCEPTQWAAYIPDYVLTDTEGYGANFGQFQAPTWQGPMYALGGRLKDLPEGISAADALVRIYRARPHPIVAGAYEPERTAWLEVRPDPITREWSAPYLPTGHLYYYALTLPFVPNGANNEQPRFHGAYSPGLVA